ncbi:hypothetical protein CLUG_00693 [Clavispora lusitaniae ATCC 42720]|uniref:Uncharacterized protein n=1 Tax=Clavispora lusitaniae (strain ATCC 42720) TaxID=306902 RepID=C4XXM1_CLAL4|nr:uncharacterized protein CLUG_00693 [Clavispora lusitaniae ATCC 42720]EEQ36570.1 hypothetical protein CLUG_00693 [Clavispora lusitaniae ATCC 42720]
MMARAADRSELPLEAFSLHGTRSAVAPVLKSAPCPVGRNSPHQRPPFGSSFAHRRRRALAQVRVIHKHIGRRNVLARAVVQGVHEPSVVGAARFAHFARAEARPAHSAPSGAVAQYRHHEPRPRVHHHARLVVERIQPRRPQRPAVGARARLGLHIVHFRTGKQAVQTHQSAAKTAVVAAAARAERAEAAKTSHTVVAGAVGHPVRPRRLGAHAAVARAVGRVLGHLDRAKFGQRQRQPVRGLDGPQNGRGAQGFLKPVHQSERTAAAVAAAGGACVCACVDSCLLFVFACGGVCLKVGERAHQCSVVSRQRQRFFQVAARAHIERGRKIDGARDARVVQRNGKTRAIGKSGLVTFRLLPLLCSNRRKQRFPPKQRRRAKQWRTPKQRRAPKLLWLVRVVRRYRHSGRADSLVVVGRVEARLVEVTALFFGRRLEHQRKRRVCDGFFRK